MTDTARPLRRRYHLLCELHGMVESAPEMSMDDWRELGWRPPLVDRQLSLLGGGA